MYVEICTGTGETSWVPNLSVGLTEGKRGRPMTLEESDQLIVLGGREIRPQNSARPCCCLAGFGVFAYRAKMGEGADESTQPVQSTSAGR